MTKKLFLLASVCFLFLTSGCGLDVYYVLVSPHDCVHVPVYSNNYDNSYFEFLTNDESFESGGGLDFLGTEVYYKIYSNYSKMISDTETVISLSSTDETTAATRLITTYNYKALKMKDSTDAVLVPHKSYNQRVYIRLTDYLDIEDFSARVEIYNTTETPQVITKSGMPVRNIPERKTFNFGRTGTLDGAPKATDEEDVNYTTQSEPNKWYVAMFAVAVGKDYLFTQYYSNVLYLGSVTIDADSADN